jgi:hypothetical protein
VSTLPNDIVPEGPSVPNDIEPVHAGGGIPDDIEPVGGGVPDDIEPVKAPAITPVFNTPQPPTLLQRFGQTLHDLAPGSTPNLSEPPPAAKVPPTPAGPRPDVRTQTNAAMEDLALASEFGPVDKKTQQSVLQAYQAQAQGAVPTRNQQARTVTAGTSGPAQVANATFKGVAQGTVDPIAGAVRYLPGVDAQSVDRANAQFSENMAAGTPSDDTLLNQSAQAAGAMVPFVAANAAGGPVGATAYGAFGGAGARGRELANRTDITPFQRESAVAGSALVGGVSAGIRLPIAGAIARPVSRKLEQAVAPTAARLIGGALGLEAEVPALNAGTTIAENAVSRLSGVDPNRGLLQGAGQSAAVGAITAPLLAPVTAGHLSMQAKSEEVMRQHIAGRIGADPADVQLSPRPKGEAGYALKTLEGLAPGRVVYFKGGEENRANGFYDQGRVFVNVDRPADALAAIVSHEVLGHAIQNAAFQVTIEQWRKANPLLQRWGEQRYAEEAKGFLGPIPPDLLREEGTARVIQEALSDPKAVAKLGEVDPGFIGRVGDAAANVMDRLTGGNVAKQRLWRRQVKALDALAEFGKNGVPGDIVPERAPAEEPAADESLLDRLDAQMTEHAKAEQAQREQQAAAVTEQGQSNRQKSELAEDVLDAAEGASGSTAIPTDIVPETGGGEPAPAPTAKTVYTTIPKEWHGATLYDWGSGPTLAKGTGLRGPTGRKTRYLPPEYRQQLERVALNKTELVAAIRAKDGPTWKVEGSKGKYLLAPKDMVREAREEIGKPEFYEATRPAPGAEPPPPAKTYTAEELDRMSFDQLREASQQVGNTEIHTQQAMRDGILAKQSPPAPPTPDALPPKPDDGIPFSVRPGKMGDVPDEDGVGRTEPREGEPRRPGGKLPKGVVKVYHHAPSEVSDFGNEGVYLTSNEHGYTRRPNAKFNNPRVLDTRNLNLADHRQATDLGLYRGDPQAYLRNLKAAGFDGAKYTEDGDTTYFIADPKKIPPPTASFDRAASEGGGVPFSVSAWHGSPHDFAEFKMEKLGTGEGAQAYGHGLYFAGNKEVADYYRSKLAGAPKGRHFTIDGVDPYEPAGTSAFAQSAYEKMTPKERRAVNEISARSWYVSPDEAGVRKMIADLEKEVPNREEMLSRGEVLSGNLDADRADLQERRDALEMLKSRQVKIHPPEGRKGRLYDVELAPDEHEFLDWDKPLSEQSPHVQKLLGVTARDHAAEEALFAEAKRRGVDPTSLPEYAELTKRMDEAGKFGRTTGREFYGKLASDKAESLGGPDLPDWMQGITAPSPENASSHLRSLGIRGIRFLDGSSRAAGEGSHNYVVFDDKDVKVRAKFSVAAEAGVPEAKQDDPKYTEMARKQWEEKGTDSPFFKRWFGGSKVVDEQGKPLVVYHGTQSPDFDSFMETKVKEQERGFFFSPDPKVASLYSGYHETFPSDRIGGVVPAYLKMENPLIHDFKGGKYGRGDVIQQAMRDGHDGVIFRNHYDAGGVQDQYAVFSPDQIKSATGNRGTFDGENPDVRYSVAKDAEKEFREKGTDSKFFKEWSGGAPVVKRTEALTRDFKGGEPVVVEAFHGSQRPDRIGNRFQKSRATSGPMQYFTSDPEIASSYSKGKADNSLEAPEDYAGWFKYTPAGSKSAVNIDQAWYHLTPEQRQRITETLPHVTRENPDDNTGDFIVHPDRYGLSGKEHWDYEIRAARGNVLKAAKEVWLASGELFDDPGASYSGVIPTYIRFRRPLVTNDLPASLVDDLARTANRQRATPAQYGADMWDKNTRDPRDWVRQLREDTAKGDNSMVWTSIPDWVTRKLTEAGYDGIIDAGGKLGGESHKVYIPFEPNQIKSVNNRGTFSDSSPDIRFSVARDALDRAKKAADDAGDYVTHTAVPKLRRAGAADDAIAHAYARIYAPHEVNNLLAHVFPDAYQHPDEMAPTIDVLNKDNILGGYDSFMERAEKARNDGDDAAADDFHAAADAIARRHPLGQYAKDVEIALNDPSTAAAIDRWKQHVNPLLDKLYNEMKALDPGTPREGRGRYTDARINLLDKRHEPAVAESLADPDKPLPELVGNVRSPAVKRDRYDRAASFLGDYSTDANLVLSKVLGPRLNEVTKLRLYDTLQRKGLAVMVEPGTERPETVGGRKAITLPVEVPKTNPETGKTAIERKNLVIRDDVYREVRDVLGTDMKTPQNPVARALTQLQLVQLADAFTHAKNVFTRPYWAQGAGGVGFDVLKANPVVGVPYTFYKLAEATRDVMRDSPAIRERLARMASQGLLRPDYDHATLIKKLADKTGQKWLANLSTGKFLHQVDTAARVVLDRFYDNLVAQNRAPDTVKDRYRFVSQVGEYNRRLLGPMARTLRDAGFSPFVVAGRNFNAAGRRILTGDPSFAGGTKSRVVQFGMLASMAALPAILNAITTGTPTGRSGTPLGAWDTGQDDERGNRVTWDVAQMVGLRRGLKSTGLDALAEGAMEGKDANQIAGNAIEGIVQAGAHPWVGPAPGTVFAALTGRRLDLRGKMEARTIPGGGGAQYAENARAALASSNPFLYSLIGSPGAGPEDSTGSYLGDVAGAIGKTPTSGLGIKGVQPATNAAEDLAGTLARQKLGEGLTPEEAERVKVHRDVVGLLRRDPDAGQKQLDDLVKSGQIGAKEAANLTRRAGMSPLAWNVRGLSADDAMRVWDKASDEQKKDLLPAIHEKVQRSTTLTDDDRRAMQDRLLADARDVDPEFAKRVRFDQELADLKDRADGRDKYTKLMSDARVAQQAGNGKRASELRRQALAALRSSRLTPAQQSRLARLEARERMINRIERSVKVGALTRDVADRRIARVVGV